VEYLERPAPDSLRHVVQGLWAVRLDPPYRHERVFPTPALHLILNGGDPYRSTDVATGVVTTVTRVFCSGLQTSALRNELPASVLNIGARLHPDAAGAFGLDARRLAGQVVDLTDELPELAALASDLPHLPLSAALDRLGPLLETMRMGEPDPVARRFVEAVLVDPDRAVPELALEAGVGHPALIDAVRAAIGVTPKAFADLVRFDRFVDLTSRVSDRGWAMLAVEAGFYDQSHSIRVFRRFTGLTPAAYVRRVRADGAQAARFLAE
jgi:AraC-like DNA-binding protein